MRRLTPLFALLAIFSAGQAHADPVDFQIVHQSITVNRSAATAQFSVTFNQPPDFTARDGGQPDAFQNEIDPSSTSLKRPIATADIAAVIRGSGNFRRPGHSRPPRHRRRRRQLRRLGPRSHISAVSDQQRQYQIHRPPVRPRRHHRQIPLPRLHHPERRHHQPGRRRRHPAPGRPRARPHPARDHCHGAPITPDPTTHLRNATQLKGTRWHGPTSVPFALTTRYLLPSGSNCPVSRSRLNVVRRNLK